MKWRTSTFQFRFFSISFLFLLFFYFFLFALSLAEEHLLLFLSNGWLHFIFTFVARCCCCLFTSHSVRDTYCRVSKGFFFSRLILFTVLMELITNSKDKNRKKINTIKRKEWRNSRKEKEEKNRELDAMT